MELTKEQKKARSIAVKQASGRALTEHFGGADGKAKRNAFLLGLLNGSLRWVCFVIPWGSWAVVGSLLAGPGHAEFLAELHAWMVATPLDTVQAKSHDVFMTCLINCVLFAGIYGALYEAVIRLEYITKPAKEQAGAVYDQTLQPTGVSL